MIDTEMKLQLESLKKEIIKLNKNNIEGQLMLEKTLEAILFLQMYEQGYIPKHILDNKMEETRKRFQYRW